MGAEGPSSPRRRHALGVLAVVASALCFGAMAIFARAAYADGVDTTTLLALRFTLAAVVMTIVMHLRRERWPRGRTLLIAIGMGAVGYAGQSFSFFTALTLAPAGLVALLLYLHPALVAVLSAAFLRERLNPRKIAALVLALVGTALTVGSASGSEATHPAGIVFGVMAAAIYAVYIVVGARAARAIPALAMASVVTASAGLVFLSAAALRGPQLPASWIGWAAVLAIAVISTVLAISLFFAGLARIGPTRASTLSTVEPVFTILLAAWALGEHIMPVQLAGGALILFAVVLLARAVTPRAGSEGAP